MDMCFSRLSECSQNIGIEDCSSGVEHLTCMGKLNVRLFASLTKAGGEPFSVWGPYDLIGNLLGAACQQWAGLQAKVGRALMDVTHTFIQKATFQPYEHQRCLHSPTYLHHLGQYKASYSSQGGHRGELMQGVTWGRGMVQESPEGQIRKHRGPHGRPRAWGSPPLS